MTALWESINDSPWQSLPERAVRSLLDAKERVAAWLGHTFIGGSSNILVAGLCLILFAVVWVNWGPVWAIAAAVIYVAGLCGLGLFMVYGAALSLGAIWSRKASAWRLALVSLPIVLQLAHDILLCLLGAVAWLKLISSASLPLATALTFVSIPFLSVITVSPALTIVDFLLERKHSNMWWEMLHGERRARKWEDIRGHK